jgi:hypothetical protein
MHRSKMSAQERELRSRLAQFAHATPWIHATLNARLVTCGKGGCRCAQGERHRAVYLVSSAKGKKRQVFVPPDLEEEVRQWVDNYHAATDLLEQVSEGTWEELKRKKEAKDS